MNKINYSVVNARHKLKEIFDCHVDMMDRDMSLMKRYFIIDIIKFDDWMVKEKGYNIDTDGSLANFIKNLYGEQAVKFIKDVLS